MKHAKNFILILALGIFLLWGCATIESSGSGNREGEIETTQQMVSDIDKAGDAIDAKISSAIRVKFAADGLLSVSDISVDTTQGKVTLKGNVNSQAGANRAMQLGRSVDGVRSVHSSLIVKGTTTR
jgi:osmotically-inducible protein OsmY